MDVETFIQRWSLARGGAERANYQMFLTELCEALSLPRPDPASDDARYNDYVFERGVKRREADAFASTLRIDLYKRGSFILEAKQSRLKLREDQPRLFDARDAESTAAGDGRWDLIMRNARKQAEQYVFLLPPDHVAPPFIIVCDVGYVFEIYADFSGTGRGYTQFPDRKGFRIRLEDLRRPEVTERLQKIWSDPLSLDPARHAAKVTRQIAERLAAVTKRLETAHPAEEVAQFLMRCIFTMFAEDVDLLPKGQFTKLLTDSLDSPDSFAPLLEELWRKMDTRDHADRFFSLFRTHLRWFNGGLFHNPRAFPMQSEEIGELLAASSHDWRYVEPAIFGTLVEQALNPDERRKLGAHYTPRAYVERLVDVTVMEPLRNDWHAALLMAEDARARHEADLGVAWARQTPEHQAIAHERAKAVYTEAVDHIRAFHHRLCTTRVLDPACGTGNFLYVALELMKRLEGEVLETLAELGHVESIGFEEVSPHQFLGMELNPRAAAIAELVLWIGYLQQHYRNRSEHPAEPILKAFKNIRQMDAVLTWDGYPEFQFEMRDGQAVQVYPNARRPDWPEADFIVGNPPFIGGKDLRSRLEPGYAEALWRAHKAMNESADFVMYWWDRAAEILAAKKSPLQRFGLVTTNSISQVFQRRVMERHLNAKSPVSVVYAIADHPWTKATKDSAAVRIAMTVAQAGSHKGELLDLVYEAGLDTDAPALRFESAYAKINSDLTVGADVTAATGLMASRGICSPGVKLHGAGFIVTPKQAETLGLGRIEGLERHIRHYRNGKDLTARPRDVMVIDLFGLQADFVRSHYPEVYQHLYETVREGRREQVEKSPTKDAVSYFEQWWVMGKPRSELRPAIEDLPRYIATVETAKHRVFQFLSADILPDNMLVTIASQQAWHLSVLSSAIHTTWAPLLGGWLGYGNDPRYSKSRCFDPFPFPSPDLALQQRLEALGEELDATRKQVLEGHPDLTLTGLYNVLEAIKAGGVLSDKDEDIKSRGRVLILKDLHEQIDQATFEAYGWPSDLTDQQILQRLVDLNAERATEEAAGHVRWLRPDYQIPRFAKSDSAPKGQQGELLDNIVPISGKKAPVLPVFPKDKGEQVMAIRAILRSATEPMDVAAIARGFKSGGKKIEPRIHQALQTLERYAEVIQLSGGRYVTRMVA